MAFASVFRPVLASSSSALLQSLYNTSIRLNSTLATPKLFISGLSRLTTDDKLKETFSPFGRLLDVKVATDRATGKSKGYGFVTYATIEEAETAKREMNARFLDGWVIFVDPAKPRQPTRPPPPPQREQPPSSETGFRVNKTIGWCR